MIAGLRDYQERAVTMTYEWMASHQGNPCIVAPTGSGKSWIIAALCEDILTRWPETRRILVLSHVKELLEQDADKIVRAWPDAPIGVYSAGLGSRQIERITVAGIQSVYRRAAELAPADVVIVDEAHLINNRSAGMYRSLLAALRADNPALRVIGLTATPYRLGQGMITDGEDALFAGIVEPVTIQELVDRGFLAPLRSVLTAAEFDLTRVSVTRGEYNEDDLASVIDTDDVTSQIVDEMGVLGKNCKSWLIFCVGVAHALHVRDALRSALDITVETVTGETPKDERARILEAYKRGEIRALTNANVLTTGFDAPGTDLLAFCRPTLSPGLYVQMAGRGMRPAPGKTECLVLDFAGNIGRHDAVTRVRPPRRGKKQDATSSKKCPSCGKQIATRLHVCPYCGYEFPRREQKPSLALDGVSDIMGGSSGGGDMAVSSWYWHVANSRANGTPMLVVDYRPQALMASSLREYLCLMHGGYAEEKAFKTLHTIMAASGVAEQYPMCGQLDHIDSADELKALAAIMTAATPPSAVTWRKDGQYQRIIGREWGGGNDHGQTAGGLADAGRYDEDRAAGGAGA